MAKRGRPPLGSPPPIESTELVELFALWNRAIATPNGIAIASQKPDRLAAKLYAARRVAGHATYIEWKVIALADEVRIVPR